MIDQLRIIQKLYPASKWIQWEPAGPHSARAGAALAFGQPVNTYYDFTNAKTIVSLDSDFLGSGPASLRHARQFAAGRRLLDGSTEMHRLDVLTRRTTPTAA